MVLGACGDSISDAPDVADLPRPTTIPVTTPPTTLPPKPVSCVVDKGTKDGDGLKLAKSGLTIGGKAGEKPTIKVSKADAPKDVICEVMVEGTGARVATGDTIKANYVGVIRKDGKQFDASYDRGEPASFPVGVGGLISGWDRSLVGLKYGTKVVLSIPPADGYGVNGNPQAGIAGDDTLIFVIEIIEKVEQTPEPAVAPSSVAGTTAAATTVAG
jgi:peptidylprolyl isomerase